MGQDLGQMNQADREDYLWRVFRECEDFRQQKEPRLLETFRFVRGLKDKNSFYRNNIRHPLAFSAAESQLASLAPILFSADPVAQIYDPNENNYPRNQITEKILTSFIKDPLRTNFSNAYLKILMDTVWFGYSAPWTYFRSRSKKFAGRFEPVRDPDGTPIMGEDGKPLTQEVKRVLRTYHAPWLVHNDVWDVFLHPDRERGFVRRDLSGHEIKAQALGSNPVFDPKRVMFMLGREAIKASKNRGSGFHDGPESFVMRDLMAAEAGAEPLRHDSLEQAFWKDNVLAKPFVLLHYDDDNFHGTYAVAQDKSGLMELRFFDGVNYDGSSNRMLLVANQSPQDVYGTGLIEWHMDLFKLHSNFYAAAADGMALTVHPMWLVSQMFKMSGGQMSVGPGAEIPVPMTRNKLEEHVTPLRMPNDAVASGLQWVDIMKRDLELGMGQGDPQRGIFSGGRKTAFETNVVAQGSQQRIELIQQRILNDFAVPLLRKWTAMMGDHYTARDYVRMLGPDGATYVPPATEELLNSLQYIPMGSLTAADTQLRAGRWPGILKTLMETLPFMQVPWMHEAVKRSLEDQGVDGVSRLIPGIQDPSMSELMEKVAMINAGPTAPGSGSQPKVRSPGDLIGAAGGTVDRLRQDGGATAPAPPLGGNGVG